jgi:septum formation protein
MEPIILASASPRRKDLLNQAGIPFTVEPSNVDEDMAELSGSPEQKAEQLASLKAWDVAQKSNGRLVVGADTIVVLDDVIFGKPYNEDDAYKMLEKLSGCEHKVMTGIAVIDSQSRICKTACEITRVRFAHLTPDEIRSYIATGEPFGKAGAYAVQGIGALFVEGIMGCYANVVGLPLMRLRRLLEEFGVKTLQM